MSNSELARRRRILSAHIGELITFRREHTPRDLEAPLVGLLNGVNRTRAIVCFGGPETSPFGWVLHHPDDKFGVSGEWLVPIAHLILPGSVEPLPGQRELFA